MRQSSVIFGALIIAFIVYITVRGQLPKWIGLFSSETTSTTGTNQEQSVSPATDKIFGPSADFIPDFLRKQIESTIGDVFSQSMRSF